MRSQSDPDRNKRNGRNGHVRLVGRHKYVARYGNPANLGDARLYIVDRSTFDQSRKIGRRQDIFTDRNRHTARADRPRCFKILWRPNRLLDPFEIKFSERPNR